MTNLSVAVGSTITTSLFFDRPSNACWFGTADGRIVAVRVLGPRVRDIGHGWSDLVAAFPTPDGLGVLAFTSDGEIRVAASRNATPAGSVLVCSMATGIASAVGTQAGRVLVLDGSGTVSILDPWPNATPTTLVGPIADATAIAVDDTTSVLYVVSRGAAGSTVRAFDLASGNGVIPDIQTSDEIISVSRAPVADAVFQLDDAGNVRVRRSDGSLEPSTLSAVDATSIASWYSLVAAAVGDEIRFMEWALDVGSLPITSSLDPLFMGGWASIQVDYGAAGIVPASVAWQVREGPDAATISVAIGSAGPAAVIEHRVIAGLAGEFHVEAVDTATASILAAARFRAIDLWPDDDVGPARAVTGFQQTFAKWGGGSPGPQNIRKIPAPEEFKVAVAIMRIKGSKSAVNGDARRDQFTKHMADPARSVRTYYEEVSYRSTPASPNPAHPKGTTVDLVTGAAFGPIDVPFSWGELFDMGNSLDPWGSWNPKGNTWDTFGGTFSSYLADLGLSETVFRSIQSVVFAVLPGSDAPVKVGEETLSSQWPWAWAGDAQVYWKNQFSTGFWRVPAVVMPAAFPSNHPTPWVEDDFLTTICHELGHNLSCPDLYGPFIPETAGRDVDTWDLMSTDKVLPHFSLPHRMRLGWIDPSWIEAIDFGGTPSSRTVTLRAIETITRSGPPAGERAGVEIRVRDGWNYYFEYRRGQATQIGDRHLGVSSAVFGTDVHEALAEEFERPLIMKLANDVDSDGPVLVTMGKDYEESDISSPERMHDFVITRGTSSLLNRDIVSVDITYLSAHRAELQIAPAPGRGHYKSPDIDLAGPAGANAVVKGQKHIISARVRNAGTKDANDVHVRVSWLPFTTAAGSWTVLPDPPRQAVPAHQTRTFTLDWTPPASLQVDGKEVEHFCVKVDIDRYIDPLDPAGSEIVIFNNWAQSNFNTDAVGHGSPSDRRSSAVLATNKLQDRLIHRTVLDQSSEHFRAYIDRGWIRLNPGETAVTELSYESLAGDPIFGADFQASFEGSRGEIMVNDLVARTMVVPKQPADGDIQRTGVQLRVRAGLRSRFERFEGRGEVASGLIVAGDPGVEQPVDGGPIRIVAWPEARPDEPEWADGTVEADGTFFVVLPGRLVALAATERVVLQGFYHGTTFFAPCISEPRELQ